MSDLITMRDALTGIIESSPTVDAGGFRSALDYYDLLVYHSFVFQIDGWSSMWLHVIEDLAMDNILVEREETWRKKSR